MAIVEYLEEKFSESPSLLSGNSEDRAQIRAIALQIVANTQPLQNLAVLQYVSEDPALRKAWAQHWINNSFNLLERQLAKTAGKFAFGDKLSVVDICIPPQVYNAKRFGVDMSKYPTIARLDKTLAELPAFLRADCHHQPDTPPEERHEDN
jgi:maleylacetoacetate isomerase